MPIKYQLCIPSLLGLAPGDQYSTVCLCGCESVSECDSYMTHCWVSPNEDKKFLPTQQVSDGFQCLWDSQSARKIHKMGPWWGFLSPACVPCSFSGLSLV